MLDKHVTDTANCRVVSVVNSHCFNRKKFSFIEVVTMKRKIYIPIIVALVLVAIAFVWYMMPKTFAKSINPDEVAYINVFDGRTGTGFTIDNQIYIDMIVRNLQTNQMKKSGISIGRMGYGFKIEGLDKNGNTIIPVLMINSESTIRKDPFFYITDRALCMDLLEEIEALEDTYYTVTDIVVDSENNQITYLEVTDVFIVNAMPYNATGKSFGEVIFGEEVKGLVFPLSDERIITAWAPISEGTIGVYIDGEWFEYIAE